MSDSSSRLFRVVLVEDSSVLCSMISDMFSDIEGVTLVGVAATEGEALAQLAFLQPDMVVVDLELASGSGLNVLREVSRTPQDYGHPKMVVFSNYAHPAVQARCASLGACAFFDKSFQLDELLSYIKTQTDLLRVAT